MSLRTSSLSNVAIGSGSVGGGDVVALGTKALGLQNAKQSNTSKFRNVIGRGISGTARGRLLCVGTSVVRGTGSNAPATFKWSWPSLLRLILTGAKDDYFCGDGGSGSVANLIANDPRISTGGTVATVANKTLGGVLLQLSTNATVTFTPGNTFDTAHVITAQGPGNGTFTVSIDGGVTPIQTISTNGATAPLASTVAVTAGSSAVTIKCTVGSMYLAVLGTRTSTAAGVEIINAGYGGSVIADHTSTGSWFELDVVGQLLDANAVNAIVADPCCINDANAATNLATYSASVTSWLTALKNYGDVLLTIPPTVNPATYPTYGTYCDAAVAAAVALDLPVLDMRKVFPSYSTTNMSDNAHPNGVTYAQWAKAIAALI